MLNIPEGGARSYAPNVLVVRITEDKTGMNFHHLYGCTNFRMLSQLLHRIKTGSMYSPGYTVRNVYLAYNAVELPVPIEGIPGSAQ